MIVDSGVIFKSLIGIVLVTFCTESTASIHTPLPLADPTIELFSSQEMELYASCLESVIPQSGNAVQLMSGVQKCLPSALIDLAAGGRKQVDEDLAVLKKLPLSRHTMFRASLDLAYYHLADAAGKNDDEPMAMLAYSASILDQVAQPIAARIESAAWPALAEQLKSCGVYNPKSAALAVIQYTLFSGRDMAWCFEDYLRFHQSETTDCDISKAR